MKGCISTADLQGTNRAQIQLSGGWLQIGMLAGIKSEFALSVPKVALISCHKDPRMLFRYTHFKAVDVAAKLAQM
jgi:hypothetical protein